MEPRHKYFFPEQENGGGGEENKPPEPNNNGGPPRAVSGVRYGVMNWIGEFKHPANLKSGCGAKVVIQSDRGIELGQIVPLTAHDCPVAIPREQIKAYVDASGPDFYRLRAGRILREASTQDLLEHEKLNEHIRDDIDRCEATAKQYDLDMKVVTAEHLLGGERIVFYFRSEGRIDFRELVRELARYYQTRIEMRQVGARDEARLIADYEVCGRECCCKNFLKKLRPITMRMAKLQKSTLDPSKVSGRCGRLRCCLRYEHQGYDELVRNLPRVGAKVDTESGLATVIDRQVLTQLLLLRGEDNHIFALPVEEVSPPGTRKPPEPPPAPEPAEQPQSEPAKQPSAGDQDSASDEQKSERPRRRRRGGRRQQSRNKSDRKDEQSPSSTGDADRGKNDARADAAPGNESDRNSRGDAGENRKKPRGRRRRRKRPRGDSGGGSGAGDS